MMLLWAASEYERGLWAQAFKDSVPPEKPTWRKQLVTDENEFVVTLYKCLVPERGPDGKPLPGKSEFEMRVEQKGCLMKTSQKYASFLRKKNYFHLRYFSLNIATGLLQAFEFDGNLKNEKTPIDLRNRVIRVQRLGSSLRPDYMKVFRSNCEDEIHSLSVPHDYRLPFSVVYLGDDDKLDVMVLWADTEMNRDDWIDAFEYIRTDFKVPEGKTIEDLVVPLKRNDFVVSFSKSMIDYDPGER